MAALERDRSSDGGGEPADPRPLDVLLADLEGPGSLVAIAREGRLTRRGVRVELAAVDEAALALVGLALDYQRNVTIVYPAPAGEVSVLLAAEILIRRLMAGQSSQRVGIVTSDTARATGVWGELAISSPGSRTPISDYFPVYRAGPDGDTPFSSRQFRGSLIGRRFGNWPVDVVVVDHLSGQVHADPLVPTIRLFADALDPELERLAASGELIWGWTEGDLALLTGFGHDKVGALPFSVAAERLATMAAGVSTTIHVAHHSEGEQAVRRLRDDLRTLSELAGASPPVGILRGIRVAWQHVSTLVSLPCRPSQFDRFAGLPPIAARPTRTFEPEIAAWAKTLTGDLREVAEVVASDLGDLRALLEEANPFARELGGLIASGSAGIVVVRTRTAARALIDTLGGDPEANSVGPVRVVPLRRLHREGAYPRAIVVGTPARWDWNRIDSGLTPDLHVLVLGDLDAYLGRRSLEALRVARSHWGSEETRERVWRELVGSEPPAHPCPPALAGKVEVVNAIEAQPTVDPFEALQPLLTSIPLAIGDEGVEDTVGEEGDGGQWMGDVEAVEVVTDAGHFLLPRDRLIDVRVGDAITECKASALQPGMVLLVDRRGGRIGLLEAVADRLSRSRPDLLAASMLIGQLRRDIQRTYQASQMTPIQLYQRLAALGFQKSYQAARGYVDENGPLAPRDLEDLKRLNQALAMGMADQRLREVFAGVGRWRTFKRAAGKALVAASRDSLLTTEVAQVDHDTGLSIADLRELVLEAVVVEVRGREGRVPLAEIGFLRDPSR